jgi:hypothetical protein
LTGIEAKGGFEAAFELLARTVVNFEDSMLKYAALAEGTFGPCCSDVSAAIGTHGVGEEHREDGQEEGGEEEGDALGEE